MNAAHRRLLIIAILFTAPGAFAWARPDSSGLGAYLSAGDGGYSGVTIYGDLGWRRGPLAPYAWSEFLVDSFLTQLTVGGGVWKDLPAEARGKLGASVASGELEGSEDSATTMVRRLGDHDRRRNGTRASHRLRPGRRRIPPFARPHPRHALRRRPPGSLRGRQGQKARRIGPDGRFRGRDFHHA
jgi:hypothetical protein